MALKLSACPMVVLVLALTTATIDITGRPGAAAAQECGACSQKCVADCRPPSSQNCESLCRSTPHLCDTCEDVVVWKRCAAVCYVLNCLSSAVQCPPQFTACSACDQTCDSPCDDLDQVLCAGDCLLLTGDPSSPECAACKDRARKSCADACRAIVCGTILSCPPLL